MQDHSTDLCGHGGNIINKNELFDIYVLTLLYTVLKMTDLYFSQLQVKFQVLLPPKVKIREKTAFEDSITIPLKDTSAWIVH